MKSESGLDVVSSDEADLNSNYIFSIDPVLPGKVSVLSYLYNNGPEVQVKAKVSISVLRTKYSRNTIWELSLDSCDFIQCDGTQSSRAT